MRDQQSVRETVQPRAATMAQDMMMTLFHPIRILSWRSKGKHLHWHDRFISGLEWVCLKALILKGEMDATPHQYVLLFAQPGTPLDPKKDEPEAYSDTPVGNVHLPINPSVKYHGHRDDNNSAVIWAKGRVIMNHESVWEAKQR